MIFEIDHVPQSTINYNLPVKIRLQDVKISITIANFAL